VPLNRIFEPEFAQYLNGSRPYKLVNFTGVSPEDFALEWPFDHFRQLYADRVVSFYVCASCLLYGLCTIMMPSVNLNHVCSNPAPRHPCTPLRAVRMRAPWCRLYLFGVWHE
jgi:hypothetical protein